MKWRFWKRRSDKSPAQQFPPQESPPPYDTSENWSNWKKQPWASREAKKKERRIVDKSLWDWTESAQQDATQLTRELQDVEVGYRTLIAEAFKFSDIITPEQSGNPKWLALQATLTDMWESTGTKDPAPKLIIHQPDSRYSQPSIMWVAIPDFIEGNSAIIHQFDMKLLKALMAHEIAHHINRDHKPSRRAMEEMRPPTEKGELLAERMGAIIYGNPREYAKVWASEKFIPDLMYTSHNKTPSTNRIARMTNKWAQILENEGAASKEDGRIINKEKALKIFERSKDFTVSAANVDSFLHK